MKTKLVAVVLLILAAFGGLVFLFINQNSHRTTQLSFSDPSFGLFAHQLAEPVTIPALMGICFGAGLLFGCVLMAARGLAVRRRVRSLEQQIALNPSNPDDDWA